MARSAGLSRQDVGKPFLLIAAMAVGIGINLVAHGQLTWLSPAVEVGVFLVLTAIMITVRPRDIGTAFRKRKATGIVLATNFLIIPSVAWLLGWLFLRQWPDLWIGVILYTLTPCVGWYLIFTDLAEGNVAWGASLLPWNLGLQIVLMPLYMWLLIGRVVTLNAMTLLASVGGFFVLPFLVGWGLRWGILTRWNETVFQGPVQRVLGEVKLWSLVTVILALFASQPTLNVGSLRNLTLLIGVLVLFFVLLFGLALLTGRLGQLSYEDNATLAFTTTARNSEAVIGVALVAFPGHPLVYMAILLGPLVELPILLLMARMLVRLRGTLWPSASGVAP